MNISEANSTSIINPYTTGTVILRVSCAVNFILCVPTDVYILWLIVTGAAGTLASELFTLNLAVSEILFCVFSIPMIVYTNIQSAAFRLSFSFGYSFMFTGRPLFQCCICVERYLAVVHPVIFLKYKPLRYRLACCGAVWLLVLLGNLISMFLSQTLISDFFFLIEYLILTCVMLFCCLAVLRALKQTGPGEGDREGNKNAKMKAFRIISIISVTMFVSYCPILVIMPLSVVLDRVVWQLSYCSCFSVNVIGGFVQPLLYLHRAGKIPGLKAL
ncbi:hypothetical protein DPEC_G00015540 [Dallia pectoralis]|uniref:Uncharacterized protein n=1 Tax=Dallia pectoralis TaxID=75939 RepID=A0ACC2HN55_DALPE|nr:hypothetical protein DPEC_G00015540 [Dallia pectoralis]